MNIINKFIRACGGAVLGDMPQGLFGGKGTQPLCVPKIAELCRSAAADGIVLLRNRAKVLPLHKDATVAVFGRCAYDYIVCGYGSGGDVRYPYQRNLMYGLQEVGISVNQKLNSIYESWRAKPQNVPDEGFWGHWALSFDEMELEESDVRTVAEECDTALVVIGRAAGEERDNVLKPGSYYLTKSEKRMLSLVTKYFQKVVLIMDCGNMVDLSFMEEYEEKIDAILYAWLGGMEAGTALADILTGVVNPSAKLTDTVACHYEDHPSAANFGRLSYTNYVEDIYVGYRYFETFQKRKVLYPFGYGLSYTTFHIQAGECDESALTCSVKNTGTCAGREVVQVYCSAPQGKVGKPAKVLIGFQKTGILESGQSEEMTIQLDQKGYYSYDDTGVCGHKDAWVMERGTYELYIGSNVRDLKQVYSFERDQDEIQPVHAILQLQKSHLFDRMINQRGSMDYQSVPFSQFDLRQRIIEGLPVERKQESKHRADTFEDVQSGNISLEEYVAQLSDEELIDLSRGYGKMNYPQANRKNAGNAGALGGVTTRLQAKRIPSQITVDGPAGIRLKHTAALLPCGTALASSFDLDMIEQLYRMVAEEMKQLGCDILLAPGMNIHRNPLCGRNFEYFSEDPFLSGRIAAAVVNGLEHAGVSACPKHFAANNQEKNRGRNDSRVSERALREIYLRNFEIMLHYSKPSVVMTSYNKINGVWSHYNYDLVTTVLRNEWGYDGVVITDWWMRAASSPEFPGVKNDAYRIRAGVDVLMPGGNGILPDTKVGNTLKAALENKDGMTRAALQETARRVLQFLLTK